MAFRLECASVPQCLRGCFLFGSRAQQNTGAASEGSPGVNQPQFSAPEDAAVRHGQ